MTERVPSDRAHGVGLGGCPVEPGTGSRRGVGIGEVTVRGFWGERQETNRAATLEHCYEWMSRLGWIGNFERVAAGDTRGPRPGWQFSDSEVYKLMEALAWESGRTGDARAEELLAQLTEVVGRAQDPDGYLNTCFGHDGQPDRYSDLSMGHELYCVGHLLQAAVAQYRVHGGGELVDIARRAADHVCREFGPGGNAGFCGHPGIELGLVELGRAVGEQRYGEQAGLFLQRRGHRLLQPPPLLGSAYFQDDVPVRQADAWRGHAVRALYLSAAAVDVAVDTGDRQLLEAIERQWEHSVRSRTYVTGGMGWRHQDEGFGEDWELPPDRAYCETCAGVASVMVSWRLYLATGDVRYVDLMERTFYNVIAASPAADGKAFFYANPLQQRTPGTDLSRDRVNQRAEGGVRAPWFDVSCCPTNVARTMATWGLYSVSVSGDEVSLLHYAPADVRVRLPDGGVLDLQVVTDYPADGRIHLEVRESPDRPVSLRLRVPSWATGATLFTPDGRVRHVEPGWAVVAGPLRAGNRVVLALPTQPRLTWPDRRIDAVRGCVVVERGPLVLCAESVDVPPGTPLELVEVDGEDVPHAVGQGAVLRAFARGPEHAPDACLPYGSRWARPETPVAFQLRLVPYHAWAERGPSTMRVFLPVRDDCRSQAAADPGPQAKPEQEGDDGGGAPACDAAEVDAGARAGVTSLESAELKRLKKENAELKRANAILNATSAFFVAELDRPQR